MKLALKKPKRKDAKVFPWSSCLPFVENSRGILIHRPREVSTYKNNNRPSHIGIGHWCGNHVSGGNKFTFLPAPPEGKLLCARCEQNAVANGLPSADELAGRHVHIGKCVAVQMCCHDSAKGEKE